MPKRKLIETEQDSDQETTKIEPKMEDVDSRQNCDTGETTAVKQEQAEDEGLEDPTVEFTSNFKFPPLMGEFLSSSKFSDCAIFCEDKVIVNAHRMVLAAASPTFHDLINMLDNIKSEGSTIEVKIPCRIVHHLMQVIYQGRCDVNGKDVAMFKEAAEYFQVKVFENSTGSSNSLGVDFSQMTVSDMMDNYCNQVPDGYLCRVCFVVYKSKNVIQLHFQDIHINAGITYICRKCNKNVKTINACNQHLSKYHKDLKGVPRSQLFASVKEE